MITYVTDASHIRQNTSGESANTVLMQIAETLWPKYTKINKKTMATHVKNKYDVFVDRTIYQPLPSLNRCRLKTAYKNHSRKLQATGGGVGGDDQDGDDSGTTHLAFYIGAEGPNDTTTPEALNIWSMLHIAFVVSH